MANKKIIYEGTFTLPAASDSEQKEEEYSVLLEVADPLEPHFSEREAWERAIQNQYEMFEVKSLCALADKKNEFRGFEFALRLKRCDTGSEHKTILNVRPRILHAGKFINY
jgi:hypothetical protein